MANILSEPSEIATYGEKRFFYRIRDIFENVDHLIVYCEPIVRGLHLDYSLISPKYGVIIVEIKDFFSKKWDLNIDLRFFSVLNANNGECHTRNVFSQGCHAYQKSNIKIMKKLPVFFENPKHTQNIKDLIFWLFKL
ncbi:MAG: hypothetical protein R6U96_19305 [Promethearchaeia archaeon]